MWLFSIGSGLAAVFRHDLMEALEPGVRYAPAQAEACHNVVFDPPEQRDVRTSLP